MAKSSNVKWRAKPKQRRGRVSMGQAISYLAESGFHGINDVVDARQRAGEVQGHKQEEDGDDGGNLVLSHRGGDLLKQATVVVIFQLEQCSFALFADGYFGCLSGGAVRG